MAKWRTWLAEYGLKPWHATMIVLAIVFALVALAFNLRLFLSGAMREPNERMKNSLRMARLTPEGCHSCTSYGTVDLLLIAGAFTGPADFEPGVLRRESIMIGDTDVVIAVFSEAEELLWLRTLGSKGADRMMSIFPRDSSVYAVVDFGGTPYMAHDAEVLPIEGAEESGVQVVRFDRHGDLVWIKNVDALKSDSAYRGLHARLPDL